MNAADQTELQLFMYLQLKAAAFSLSNGAVSREVGAVSGYMLWLSLWGSCPRLQGHPCACGSEFQLMLYDTVWRTSWRSLATGCTGMGDWRHRVSEEVQQICVFSTA